MEGTGEEIAKYTLEHPHGRFQLVLLSDDEGDPVDAEEEYTDEQFQADVRKAGGPLAKLRSKAREEHSAGKTEPFPEQL
jgi:hypothetical protein